MLTTSPSMVSHYVPLELINSILPRLPVKALIRFLCVSKEWSALINSSNFIKKQLNHSIETNSDRTLILKETIRNPPLQSRFFSVPYYDNDQFGKVVQIYQPLHNWDILDFCHGLVCLLFHKYKEKDDIAIWNPLIRKYRKLPREPIGEPESSYDSFSRFGFGYDLSNDDYKVVRIAEFYEGPVLMDFFEVKVYSLKSQCWKKIEKQLPIKEIWSMQSVSLNGAFHWIVEQDDGLEYILAFDLANEKFRLYSKPLNEGVPVLDVLGGCLCFIEVVDETYSDFWLMKEYGDESSWTRIYKIEPGAVPWNIDYFKPLLFSKNGKKVLMEHVSLFWYDIEKKRGKKVRNQSFPKRFRTATCIGSLVLLDGNNVIDPK